MFRGRETTHPERGERLLMRLAEDVAELGTIEQRPNQDGRNMTMVLGPVKARRTARTSPPRSATSPTAASDSRRNRAAAEAARGAGSARRPRRRRSRAAGGGARRATARGRDGAASEPTEQRRTG